jgi:hypothetical protein
MTTNFAHRAYHRSTATQWSRIDLLVALYDATRRNLEIGAEVLSRDEKANLNDRMLLAQRQLLAILEGVLPGERGSGDNVRRLLIYCLDNVSRRTAKSWHDAATVIGTLHSAFAEIQDEARALEQRGEIPAFDAESKAIVA